MTIPRAFVARQLPLVQSAEAEVGDVSLLPESFSDSTGQSVDGMFGSGFAKELDKLETGSWQGPIRSGLGLHLIRISSRTPGQLPRLDEIRPFVEREWSSAKKRQMREAMNERLLEDYEVVIEWA